MPFVGAQAVVGNPSGALAAGVGGPSDSRRFLFTNQDTISVFLGGSNVDPTTGYELKPGASVDIKAMSGDDLRGITVTGGMRIDRLRNR